MRQLHHTIIWTSLGLITLGLSAGAQAAQNNQVYTSGDLWIASDSPTWVADRDLAQSPSTTSMFVSGDVWLTREDVSTVAQALAPHRPAAGEGEQVRMGSAQ